MPLSLVRLPRMVPIAFEVASLSRYTGIHLHPSFNRVDYPPEVSTNNINSSQLPKRIHAEAPKSKKGERLQARMPTVDLYIGIEKRKEEVTMNNNLQ